MKVWWESLEIKNQISIIVVIVSLISLIVNTVVSLIMKKKDIKANLVSKARIEWIQKVRIITADLITSLESLANKNRYSTKTKIYDDITKIFNAINLLKLYLGPDLKSPTSICNKETNSIDIHDKKTNIGKNEEIINFLTVIYKKIQVVEQKTIDDSEKTIVYLESVSDDTLKKDIEDLTDVFRTYLKLEWRESKKGK